MKNNIAVVDEYIISKIYLIRGQKVMLDRDLAELYNVETKVLKQAVNRNLDRFPEDFMFEMTKEELEEWRSHFGSSIPNAKDWRSQFVTSNPDPGNWRTQIASSNAIKMGLRYKPFCFTEQGVAMLSSVLNSERAVKVNIQIIRLFIKMRKMLLTNKEILLKLEQLEGKVSKHDDEVRMIFNALKQLLKQPVQERKPIGFKLNKQK